MSIRFQYHNRTKVVLAFLFLLTTYSITYFKYFNLYYLLGILLVWIVIGGIGVEIGLHRLFSHNMYKTNNFTRRFIGLLGSMALNGDPIFWSSIHKGSHHKHADTINDVHSPMHGKLHSYLGWIVDKKTYNYINMGILNKEILKDKYFQFYHRYYMIMVLVIFSIIYLIDSIFFFCSFVPGVFLSFNQGPITNYFCHTDNYGYRNFETNDNSRNIKFLSYLTFGLALHNNHHKYPGNPNFAATDNELDLGYKLSNLIGLKHNR